MVDLAPFRGLRYHLPPGHDQSLATVTAPPYDAIDPELARRLHDRSPFNVVRLELSRSGPGGADRYARAAAAYAEWCDQHVLGLDPEPALYAYEQRCRYRGDHLQQRGILAAMELEPWEAGAVLPHERIFRQPVVDRLRLLEALPVNLSPVYLLTEDEPKDVSRALDAVTSTAPQATFVAPEDAVEHRLWPVTDQQVHDRVRAAYRDRTLLMADGHHRYTTALAYRARHPDVPGSERILAFVVGERGSAGGPVVQAMHRLVRRWPAEAADRLRRAGFDLQPVRVLDTGDWKALAGAVQAALAGVGTEQPAFGLLTANAAWLVVPRVPTAVDALRPSDLHAAVRGLDVAVLQGLLGMVGMTDGVGEVRYTADAVAAAFEVVRGSAGALLLVRPVSLEQVWAVARARGRMPPKTTSFYPKPRTGLVLRPLDG